MTPHEPVGEGGGKDDPTIMKLALWLVLGSLQRMPRQRCSPLESTGRGADHISAMLQEGDIVMYQAGSWLVDNVRVGARVLSAKK